MVGWVDETATMPQGGRQKARDLFDLYVLSHVHLPIKAFITTLPYHFPVDAFEAGIANMPWFELADELEEIICPKKWQQARDIETLRMHLFSEIGMQKIVDDIDTTIGVSDGNAS